MYTFQSLTGDKVKQKNIELIFWEGPGGGGKFYFIKKKVWSDVTVEFQRLNVLTSKSNW